MRSILRTWSLDFANIQLVAYEYMVSDKRTRAVLAFLSARHDLTKGVIDTYSQVSLMTQCASVIRTRWE